MAETIKIGGELESMATGNVVAAASAIKDKAKNKYQGEINAEVDIHLESLDNKTDNTDADLESLENRVHSVEELAEISVGGGNIQIANTGEDIQPGSGKVATANALADAYGSYVENPEFVCVKIDAEGKILWAIRTDGNIYYGAGVPKQVIDYITEKIEELSLDEYEDIVAFLNDLEKGDKTLQDLLDEKVDIEEGKSLIDAGYANGVHYIENPEFAEVKVDNEDRILEAIMKDGTKLLPAGVKVIGTAEYDGATIKTVENPEFAGVWLDGGDKILFGVEQDGNFLFGCGVPKQVKEYIEQKIEELSLDEYESIVAFIGDYLNNTTLEELLNKKVDGEYVENPEFIEAKVDNENKILEATEKDGTKLFGGDVKVLGSIGINGVIYKVVSNQEWLKVVLDSENRIICGIKADGRFVAYIADFLDDIEAIKARLEELDAYRVTESLEFMEVELDADDKVLGGRKKDGTKFENTALEIGGHTLENIEDPEGRSEITTDSDGKLISYRKDDGILVENVGIETPNVIAENISVKEVNIEGGEATLEKATLNSLELTNEGMTEFQQALKDTGFQPGGAGNWSDYISNDGDAPLQLPEPRCAILNFTGIDNFPITKTADVPAIIEYWDRQGNYFKKNCILNAHGQSTLMWPKKNITIDLFDSEVDGDAFGICFGDWVVQDSFHLKAYYTDPIKGWGAVAYWLYEDFMKTRSVLNDRPYKPYIDSVVSALASDEQAPVEYTHMTGARCFPDGFPAIVYLNGEFWGIFGFQLKKNRKNYYLDKKTAENVYIEGHWGRIGIFDGTISWLGGDYGMEVKNPSSLYYQRSKDWEEIEYNEGLPAYEEGHIYEIGNEVNYNGHSLRAVKRVVNSKATIGDKYDFDGGHSIPGIGNDQEIMGTNSPFYIASNKDFKRCAKAKQYIETLSQYIPQLKAMEDAQATTEEIRAAIEAKFNVSFMIDYLLHANVIGNHDSIDNNCQWTTYDGVLWNPNPYDMNNSMYKRVTIIGSSLDYPFGWCWKYFEQEMSERYAELKAAKVIDSERITRMIQDWMIQVGEKYFELENEKWPNCGMQGDVINTAVWREVAFDNSYPLYVLGNEYPKDTYVKYEYAGEWKSFISLRAITTSPMLYLIVNYRMKLSDYKDVLDNNIALLDSIL